jgi:NAD(P)-dependent dehydrogenase (short-subunit alcohol dehydrogenase family)
MDESLNGRVALITGAGSGIGRATALGFAAQGAQVIATVRTEQSRQDIQGEGITTVVCDVRRYADVASAVHVALDCFGRLDILFNNAGIDGHTRLDELAEGEFENFVAVHLFGGIYGMRAALPVMRRQGYGRIVNMLSRGAQRTRHGMAAYAASKSGLFAATRVAASENSDLDILINGIIPGPTQSKMYVNPAAQPPEAVVPCVRWLATLPTGGPRGKVFWDMEEYHLFRDDDEADNQNPSMKRHK